MPKTWRTFISLELPENTISELRDLQEVLKQNVSHRAARWVRPHRIHLTLKFLGDIEAAQVESVKAALDSAVAEIISFNLHLKGLGCFPNVKRPRVLWAGLSGAIEELNRLQAQIENQIIHIGFEPEDRKFAPHLTLARSNRQASRKEITQLGKLTEDQQWHDAVKQIGEWRVDGVSLMRSQLKSEGAIYTQLHRAHLIDG